jgi:hypothetical protein
MKQAPPHVLCGAASAGLLALTAAGCELIAPFDTSGLRPSAETKYHCQADVIDQFSLRSTIFNEDDPAHEGVVSPQCFIMWEDLGLETVADVEDAWHKWLDQAIAAEGWCIVAGSISCAEAGPLGDETCPAIAPPAAPRDFCAPDDAPCCVHSSPSEIAFDVLQPAAGMEDWTAVGFTSPLEPAGTLQNTCDHAVDFRPRDGLVGDAAADFELLNNTCVVPEPQEDHPDGLTLSPMGTAGDYCTFQVRFTPQAHGVRWARLDFVQADTAACGNPDMAHFHGRGRAGSLSGIPAELCLGLLADGRCTQASFELTNDGPGLVAVETLDVTGSFELLSAATLELAPETSATVTVGWCAGFAGDVDEDGTLTLESNARREEILVPLTRRAAGCS